MLDRPAHKLEKTLDAEFQEIMHTYGTKVLRTVYLLVKDRSLAEDLTQDVFVKVYQNLHKFRGESSLHTWIYRIAVNRCKTHLRSWSVRHLFPFGEVESESGDTVEGQTLRQLDREQVTKAVMSLPPLYRQVIVLHYYQELSIPEVSEVLGIREGAVRTRLHRARQQLEPVLREEGLGWT